QSTNQLPDYPITPLPDSPLVLAPVAIFQPDDIVELRRGNLEDIAVFDRRHAVNRLGRDVYALAGKHFTFRQPAALVNLEQQPAGVQVDRLVLDVVVLQAERMAGVDVDQFADVAIGLGPME